MISQTAPTGRAAEGGGTMIAVIQPCVPHYRVPFFRELAQRLESHARLCLVYSELDENRARTAGDLGVALGSRLDLLPVARMTLPGGWLFWQQLPWWALRNADVVVVNWNIRYLSTVLLVIWRFICRRRVIGWGHYEGRSGSRTGQCFRQLLMRLFWVFWCYTKQEARKAEREHPALKGIVVGLNNALEVDTLSLDQAQRHARQKSYRDVCRFLYIGRVTRKSEFSILLEALRRLEPYRPAVCIEVIGEILDPMQLQVASGHAHSRVHYHGPVFEPAAISKIADECHYSVYPGAVGLSLLHAFSLGLPAIIHDCDSAHMPEAAAANQKNTMRFYRGDPDSLAAALRAATLLPHADYLSRVDACIDAVRGEFNIAAMAATAAATLRML